MAVSDPRVDAYIEKAAPFARPILRHLRKVVHAGCPHVEETMKWSSPHYTYKGMLCGMAAFKEHCAFGFWKGSLLQEEGVESKSAEAMGQFGRIASLADLPTERTLVRLVKKAAALNDEGVTVARAPKGGTRPALKAPGYFMAALRTNKKALAAYEAFSPSHKREYLEWITEAKRDETRQRRLETALQWMAEGKPHNWKYMNR